MTNKLSGYRKFHTIGDVDFLMNDDTDVAAVNNTTNEILKTGMSMADAFELFLSLQQKEGV